MQGSQKRHLLHEKLPHAIDIYYYAGMSMSDGVTWRIRNINLKCSHTVSFTHNSIFHYSYSRTHTCQYIITHTNICSNYMNVVTQQTIYSSREGSVHELLRIYNT